MKYMKGDWETECSRPLLTLYSEWLGYLQRRPYPLGQTISFNCPFAQIAEFPQHATLQGTSIPDLRGWMQFKVIYFWLGLRALGLAFMDSTGWSQPPKLHWGPVHVAWQFKSSFGDSLRPHLVKKRLEIYSKEIQAEKPLNGFQCV